MLISWTLRHSGTMRIEYIREIKNGTASTTLYGEPMKIFQISRFIKIVKTKICLKAKHYNRSYKYTGTKCREVQTLETKVEIGIRRLFVGILCSQWSNGSIMMNIFMLCFYNPNITLIFTIKFKTLSFVLFF